LIGDSKVPSRVLNIKNKSKMAYDMMIVHPIQVRTIFKGTKMLYGLSETDDKEENLKWLNRLDYRGF